MSYDWMIHIVADGTPCEVCGEAHADQFYGGMCDAHTHGLDKYGSLELQFVLAYPPESICYILNSVGENIRNGLMLEDGMTIDGLFEDGAKLKVFKTTAESGKPVFRLIMPDGEFRWPEDSDEYPYCLQYKSPYMQGRKELS